jgi:hypothetical protein
MYGPGSRLRDIVPARAVGGGFAMSAWLMFRKSQKFVIVMMLILMSVLER